MDTFGRRLSLDDTVAMMRSARDRGLMDGAYTILFHHLGLMRARIGKIHQSFPEQSLHAVAIKANPVVEILRDVVQSGAGLEAASIEEVHLALAADCPAERIVFDSPAKTYEEIEKALELGIYLNADNLVELDRIARILDRHDSNSDIGLRVNPEVGGGTIAQTSVATTESKFGVPLTSHRREILDAFRKYTWLRGLHVHIGSQGCGLSLLAESVDRIARLRREIAAELGRRVRNVDIGGGLPTNYRAEDSAATLTEYVDCLHRQTPDLFSADVRLITEFGRAVQANCGLAVSPVEYVKQSGRLAVIHLGADFLMRPVYQPDDWAHEFFVLDSRGDPKVGPIRPVTIAGPLCFGGDIVARDLPLPAVEPGDWIAIRDVGAYTLSMWSRHCSRGMPIVLGYDPDQSDSIRVLRQAESPVDVALYWGASRSGEIDSQIMHCGNRESG